MQSKMLPDNFDFKAAMQTLNILDIRFKFNLNIYSRPQKNNFGSISSSKSKAEGALQLDNEQHYRSLLKNSLTMNPEIVHQISDSSHY